MSQNLLSVDELTKSYGERSIFEGISFGLDRGDKVGLIGRNGAGKSTLLRLLARQEEPDAGHVFVRRDVRVAMLEQEPSLNAETVGNVLQEPFAELRNTIQKYEIAATEQHAGAQKLLERIEQMGGWAYAHRIERVAAELGVVPQETPVHLLSGGQRKRVAIARLVLEEPDLILLDEPTNHLDAATVDWLEQWLAKTRASVVVVTHDRYFLDRVASRIVEVREGAIREYRGNYTDYVAARAIEEAHRERAQHKQLRRLMGELDWARRSPKARTGKSRARLKRIDEVRDEVQRLQPKITAATLEFGAPPRLGQTILAFHDVSMAYDDNPWLINQLDFSLARGERIGVVGANGSGKSTLLELAVGRLKPRLGRIERGKNTRIAYFDQQRSVLDPEAKVADILLPDGGDTVFPQGRSVHVASWLAQCGLPGAVLQRSVKTLSGGEQSRLALAKLLLTDANVLVLDEPTNDLDVETLNHLEESLLQFKGCVLVVTHDRYFLDKIATGILAFESGAAVSGKLTLVQGNYTDYCARQTHHGHGESAQASTKSAHGGSQSAKRRAAGSQAQHHGHSRTKALTYGEALELRHLEPRIEEAEAEVRRLEQQVNDPSLWQGDPQQGLAVQKTLEEARAEAERLFERWSELMERNEQA